MTIDDRPLRVASGLTWRAPRGQDVTFDIVAWGIFWLGQTSVISTDGSSLNSMIAPILSGNDTVKVSMSAAAYR